MSDIGLLIVAISLFVGGHELLSHPLRAPLVRTLGARGFALVYSVVALGSFYWAVQIWKAIPQNRLWTVPGYAYVLAALAMLFAAVLFVGSVTSANPALMGMPASAAGPQGVQRITRHPMMWSFAIWAVVHIVLSADSRTIVLASGILVLALFGAAMQDGKKRIAIPTYAGHMAATGFVPFAAQFGRRAAWNTALPGVVATVGGVVLWAIILWAHPLLIGVPALRLG